MDDMLLDVDEMHKMENYLTATFNEFFNNELDPLIVFLCDRIVDLNKLINHVFDKVDLVEKYDNFLDYSKINLKKESIFNRLKIVSDYCKKNKIDVDIDELINNGVIDFTGDYYEELSDEIHFTGVTYHENEEVLIDSINTGSITDCAVLIHELSHYRDFLSENFGIVKDFFTEAMAYTEELFFLEKLPDKYNEEKEIIRKTSLELLDYEGYNIEAYVALHLLYLKNGRLNFNDYLEVYEDGTLENYYDILELLYSDDRELEEIVDSISHFIGKLVAIYLFVRYRNNTDFYKEIETVRYYMDVDEVEEFFKLIGITGVQQLIDSFDEYFKDYFVEKEKNKSLNV